MLETVIVGVAIPSEQSACQTMKLSEVFDECCGFGALCLGSSSQCSKNRPR